MPEPPRPLEIRFRDPLSEVTRKERTALLAASAAALVIAYTGLIPSKISALGIEFGNSDQMALLLVFQWIIWFFICAFYFIPSLILFLGARVGTILFGIRTFLKARHFLVANRPTQPKLLSK